MFGIRNRVLSVDFGSSTIKLVSSTDERPIVEPSVLAIVADPERPKINGSVIAVGEDALQMVGKTPSEIDLLWPIKDGTVHDSTGLQQLLELLLVQLKERTLWVSQEARIQVSSACNLEERETLSELVKASGLSPVRIVDRSVSAARYLGLPIDEPLGQLVIDIGDQTLSFSVLSMGGVVSYEFRKLGGITITHSLQSFLESEHKLLVSAAQAEQLKRNLDVMSDPMLLGASEHNHKVALAGKCSVTNMPIEKLIDTGELLRGIRPGVQRIAEAVRDFIDSCSPRLAADISQYGIVLIGGVASQKGLESLLSEVTNLPVIVPDDPDLVASLGGLLPLE